MNSEQREVLRGLPFCLAAGVDVGIGAMRVMGSWSVALLHLLRVLRDSVVRDKDAKEEADNQTAFSA